MNSRRGFFKSIARAVAVIAIAPQIAFSRKLESVSVPVVQNLEASSFHMQTSRIKWEYTDEWLKVLQMSRNDMFSKRWDLKKV